MGANKVNKCNINGAVATLLDNRKWGITTDREVIRSIIENYTVYLNCPTLDIDVCYPDTCNNKPELIICDIDITEITAMQALPTITFKAVFTNPGSTNNTFVWTYDTYIYDLVTNTGSDTLVLKVKPNIDMLTTTARVSVVITDDHQCTGTKTCYLVATVQHCEDYTPCSNTYDLVVTLKTP